MFMHKSKKGFTIVELVIVIAVIAILAAVLIPTFSNLVNKANIAADTQLIRNLNTALAADTAKNNTMQDALNDAAAFGYDIGKINASATNKEIMWDSVNNLFCYYDTETGKPSYIPEYEPKNETADAQMWVISKTVSDKFATYYIGTEETITTANSIDTSAAYVATVTYNGTGNNAVITTGSYDTNVVVNTDGSVSHYGQAGKITVTKVAMASFHEFGKVRTVELKKGNFVVEQGATVSLISSTAAAGEAKVEVKGTLDVVAGDVAVTGKANTTVKTAIADNTVAIVDGVAVTTLPANISGNIVLLQDYTTAVNINGNATITGNMVKLAATISGNYEITLKNIHTTNLNVSNFTGKLTLDGGMLEYDGSNSEKAALYINSGYGEYTIKNMVVAANANKGIKISKAKSVTIENCTFDASNLIGSATGDVSGTHARSLSAIDIQEQNKDNQKMTVTIKNNIFKDVPMGSQTYGVDTDTAAAIKIKTEPSNSGKGFEKVTITGNTFENCYRDVAVGVALRKLATGNYQAGKDLVDMKANAIDSKYTISGNTSTAAASVVAARGYLVYENYKDGSGVAEKVGSIVGGCAVYETAKSTYNK